MTNKQINEQLIKDVETAVNNVANAYNGSFKIKKSDEGTDRVSNFTLRLTSTAWNKDAQIKFSIDKPSEYIGDANDPIYYAACDMGMRVNFYDGFVGTKHSIELSGKPTKEKVGKFIEDLFLPTSIEILKFAKANKRKYPSIIVKKLRDFYRDMWKGTIKKVPTEEQIEQLFTNEQTNESNLKSKTISESMNSSEIKNNLVKEIIDAANKNDFKVTVANLSSVGYVRDYGKAFYRIKKGSKTGWEIVSELAKALGKLSNNDLLIGKEGNRNNPNFFIFGDSIIVCDPVG